MTKSGYVNGNGCDYDTSHSLEITSVLSSVIISLFYIWIN